MRPLKKKSENGWATERNREKQRETDIKHELCFSALDYIEKMYSPSSTYTLQITQQPTSGATVVASYQDHMTAAILVTLCCFWPTGIVAIIKASEVSLHLNVGQLCIV